MSLTLRSCYDLLESIALDPQNHALFSLLKGLRNGAIFGIKIRLPHAFIMTTLFATGTPGDKLQRILALTRQHAGYLALYSALYKLCRIALQKAAVDTVPRRLDPAWAGLVAGYVVFGRSYTPVSRQIVLYVLCQVLMAGSACLLASQRLQTSESGRELKSSPEMAGRVVLLLLLREHGWSVFAALNWAAIMYMFEWHPLCISGSGRASMRYLFLESERWSSLWTLLVQS